MGDASSKFKNNSSTGLHIPSSLEINNNPFQINRGTQTPFGNHLTSKPVKREILIDFSLIGSNTDPEKMKRISRKISKECSKENLKSSQNDKKCKNLATETQTRTPTVEHSVCDKKTRRKSVCGLREMIPERTKHNVSAIMFDSSGLLETSFVCQNPGKQSWLSMPGLSSLENAPIYDEIIRSVSESIECFANSEGAPFSQLNTLPSFPGPNPELIKKSYPPSFGYLGCGSPQIFPPPQVPQPQLFPFNTTSSLQSQLFTCNSIPSTQSQLFPSNPTVSPQPLIFSSNSSPSPQPQSFAPSIFPIPQSDVFSSTQTTQAQNFPASENPCLENQLFPPTPSTPTFYQGINATSVSFQNFHFGTQTTPAVTDPIMSLFTPMKPATQEPAEQKNSTNFEIKMIDIEVSQDSQTITEPKLLPPTQSQQYFLTSEITAGFKNESFVSPAQKVVLDHSKMVEPGKHETKLAVSVIPLSMEHFDEEAELAKGPSKKQILSFDGESYLSQVPRQISLNSKLDLNL